MKKTCIILLSVLLIGSLVFAGCSDNTQAPAATGSATSPVAAPAQPVTLVFQSFDPEDSIWGYVFGTWFKELEQQSGGRVKVEAHWNGELVPLPEVYDAITKGTLDMGTHLTSMPAGRFPMDEIAAFTSLNVITANYGRVQWELHKLFPEMQEPFSDVKVVWLGNSWPNPLGTTKKFGPVTALSDNQGMKEAVFGDWQAQLGSALGRTGVSLQPADTYSAFEKGVADGMQASITLFRTAKFGEVLPNITLMAGTLGAWSVIMNLDKFNSLPEDVQKYINDSSESLVDAFDAECLKEYQNDLAAFPGQFGTNFVTIPEDELPKWNQARQPVFDKFISDLEARGLPGQKLMAEWQRLEQQYIIK
ncbi:MAG: TRAP transporter substrate-binding protein DctP [Dehalococcoidales bacterium]|nr:TRAP transporter substrate-binding protein DctP [Dehalococcoidales bacterium]